MLDQAFEALQTYDWGADRHALDPIDQQIIASHGVPAARKRLEKRLAAALSDNLSHDAKQFLCRKLMQVGTADCVPALAKLLTDEKLSHMARYALERIDDPAAADALRTALPKASGELQAGIASSLGSRRDEASVPHLGKLLNDSDQTVARAAALALGAIGSSAAAEALTQANADAQLQAAVADASLACAEALASNGGKSQATQIYKRLAAADQPKHIKLAATRGMLAAANRK